MKLSVRKQAQQTLILAFGNQRTYCTLNKVSESSQPIKEKHTNGPLISSLRSAGASTAHLMNSIRTKLQLNNFNREQSVKSHPFHFNLLKPYNSQGPAVTV